MFKILLKKLKYPHSVAPVWGREIVTRWKGNVKLKGKKTNTKVEFKKMSLNLQ